MTLPVADAIKAYQQVATPGAVVGLEPREAGAPSFAELVQGAARDTVEVGREAERVTAAGIDGKADIAEVVAAVSNAELALQTVVAIRDRVVQAYQEIMRMPI